VIEVALKYWPIIILFGSIITTWVAWSAKRQFATHADLRHSADNVGSRVGKVEARVDYLEKDMAVIKVKLEALPSKEDIHRVELGIAGVSGNLQSLATSIKGVERMVHLLTKAEMEMEND